jgi:DNA-binding PadR family transcriptional regulator
MVQLQQDPGGRMSLRNALLVKLLDGEATGYELAGRFGTSAANYWSVRPAQLYAELTRMEEDGLVTAETVVQSKRPNKRIFSLTATGIGEIRRYAGEPSERMSLKDELMIKIAGVDISDQAALLGDIARRRQSSVDMLRSYEATRQDMLRGRDEDTFVRTAHRVGPYLTLLRGIASERGTLDWCDTATRIIAGRSSRADPQEHPVTA